MKVECDFCKETIDVDVMEEDFDENGELVEDIKNELLFEHEMECTNQDHIYIKYVAEGIDNLKDVSAQLKGIGQSLEDAYNDGWQLTQPVDTGHVFLIKYA